VAIGGTASGGDSVVIRWEDVGDGYSSWRALVANPGTTQQDVSVLAICIQATNVSGLPPE
jgi:hypothetical protein